MEEKEINIPEITITEKLAFGQECKHCERKVWLKKIWCVTPQDEKKQSVFYCKRCLAKKEDIMDRIYS